MCSAGKPADGIGSGSESRTDCGGSVCTQPACTTTGRQAWKTGENRVLGDPCSDCPNGVGVELGVLGVHSCEAGGVLVQAIWEGEGWLHTRWFWEGVTSVLTEGSVRGSRTAGVAGNAGATQIIQRYNLCVCMRVCCVRVHMYCVCTCVCVECMYVCLCMCACVCVQCTQVHLGACACGQHACN